LRTAFSVPDGTGGTTKNFVYSTILYVKLLETGDIMKVLLRGQSQGKFFDYQSTLKKEEPLLSFVTTMGIEQDKDGNYFATFTKGEPVDIKESFATAKEILAGMPTAPSLLNKPQEAQIEQPQQAPDNLRQTPAEQDGVTLEAMNAKLAADKEDDAEAIKEKLSNIPF
jgi:hypothetical protein